MNKDTKQTEQSFGSEIETEESLFEKCKNIVKHNKLAFFSILIILCAIFANVVCRYNPYTQSLKDRLLAPSFAHPLGTDELGRDTLTRVIFGARISLTIGLIPTLISMIIGTILGLIAGYFGGKIDFAIMRYNACISFTPSGNGCNVYNGRRIDKYIYSIVISQLGVHIQSCTLGDTFTVKKGVCGSS